MTVSVVIPTYQRFDELKKLLNRLRSQTRMANEIIVVSGDEPDEEWESLRQSFPELNLNVIHCEPSVCKQRNIGIETVRSDYTFLCDDDVIPERSYIEKLTDYLEKNPKVNVVSGLFKEFQNGIWSAEFPPKSLRSLIYKRIFFHSVWFDVTTEFAKKKYPRWIKKYYENLDNTHTAGGWPVITQLSNEVNTAEFYSLGASVFRSSVLKKLRFDEHLHPNGYGDNYGLILSMNEKRPIHILSTARVQHHKSSLNRVSSSKSYYYRTMAIDYFSKTFAFEKVYKAALAWSVLGHAFTSFLKGNFRMFWSASRSLISLIIHYNPYRKSE